VPVVVSFFVWPGAQPPFEQSVTVEPLEELLELVVSVVSVEPPASEDMSSPALQLSTYEHSSGTE
jgi:hypothetical protein